MQIPPEQIRQFQKTLLRWYDTHCRKLPWRDNPEPYPVWISEVMLQQTQVKTALPYFHNFLRRFPTLADFAAADLEEVLKMWEGLGYYARARNFHKAANIVIENHNGIIPDRFDAFVQLPGVGDYIGAAVQSIAFGHAFAVVDGNVKRVLARLFCKSYPVNRPASHKRFKSSAEKLLEKTDPGKYNQALMELGALVCTPKQPKCGTCPVAGLCKSWITGRVDQFPKRVKTRKTPTYHIAAGVVKSKGKLLITRRKLDGLLGGLWEFPGGKVKTNETPEEACIREIKEETNVTARVERHLTCVHHAYTHFKIRMDVFYCSFEKGPVELDGPIDYRWVFPDELDKLAFPRANNKFIPLIEL